MPDKLWFEAWHGQDRFHTWRGRGGCRTGCGVRRGVDTTASGSPWPTSSFRRFSGGGEEQYGLLYMRYRVITHPLNNCYHLIIYKLLMCIIFVKYGEVSSPSVGW
jgi:hypothetical protein